MASTVFFTNDAAVALRRAGAFLRAQPVRNTLPLTILSARAASGAPGRYWLVRERSRVTGLMLQSPLDFPAVITRMNRASVGPLVADAHARGVALPGVNGEAVTSVLFAAEWAEHTKAAVEPHRAMRLYEARRATLPATVSGHFRAAGADDEETIVEWAERFAVDIRDLAREDRSGIRARIAERRMYLWDDGGPVAMASTSPPCAKVHRVQLVYTPPLLRGRGYASALVATVTKQLLDGGDRAALYADLGNPTSNAIYRRIGYRPLGETLTFRFS